MLQSGDVEYERAMYLFEIGLGPKPAKPMESWEEYFVVKSLEQLMESGGAVLKKSFDMKDESGATYKAEFVIQKIDIPGKPME